MSMKRSTSKKPKSSKPTRTAKPKKPKKSRAAKPTTSGRAGVVKKVRAQAEHAATAASKRALELVDLVRRRMAPDLPQLITQSGRLAGRKLADMSARDIDAETARVRKIQRAKGPPTEREVRAARAARELQRWMRKHAGRPARVEAHEDHREAWIDVRVSLAEVERWLQLGRHLRAAS